MIHPVKAPSVGESITEVSILKWAKKDGDQVNPGDLLLEIESDKATVEVVAESSGKLTIQKQAGERVLIGAVLGGIDDAQKGNASTSSAKTAPAATAAPSAPNASPMSAAPSTAGARLSKLDGLRDAQTINNVSHGAPVAAAPRGPMTPTIPKTPDRPGDRRVPMSMIRTKIAERLVQAQHTAAILTTFNEVDMTQVIELRNKEKEAFKAKNGVALSFMSFFSLAVIQALKQIPEVNAAVDGKEVVYHDYIDLGIAVSSERGLVVPVLRNAEKMSMLDIEKGIAALAVKARDNKLTIQDMTGGTFTISNGGTFGSLLSTPILNYPQTGILGMHKIQERPMAVNGKIEIRPMMYLALSYDHRLIDGKQAVTFLVHIKETLENVKEKLKLTF